VGQSKVVRLVCTSVLGERVPCSDYQAPNLEFLISLRICISKKVPDDTNAAGPGATIHEPQEWAKDWEKMAPSSTNSIHKGPGVDRSSAVSRHRMKGQKSRMWGTCWRIRQGFDHTGLAS
jgi:hypothetical protein